MASDRTFTPHNNLVLSNSHAPLAQSVEHITRNDKVARSIRAGGSPRSFYFKDSRCGDRRSKTRVGADCFHGVYIVRGQFSRRTAETRSRSMWRLNATVRPEPIISLSHREYLPGGQA